MNVLRRFPLRGSLAAVCLAGLAACSNLPSQEPVYVPVQQAPAGGAASSPSPGSSPSPSHRQQAERLSPAAQMLIGQARSALGSGDPQRALERLERAQRISPRAPQVYLQLARTYRAMREYGQAQQLVLKALSLTGDDTGLRGAAWALMADIRQDAGDTSGAAAARKRAAQY